MQEGKHMTEKKYYTSQEALDYLNEKLKPEPPLNLARLARLRREKRIKGERVGEANASIYTKKALDMVTLADIQDKRKVHAANS
jgi:hypothetical protein